MLSKNQIRHLVALRSKKGREDHCQFIAEGHKLVTDLIESSFRITGIYADSSWIAGNLRTVQKKNIPVTETISHEMKQISALSTPSPVLAVIEIPLPVEDGPRLPEDDLTLILDDIRDPGNLGTILRVADWFGIENVVCSSTCVDLYNPKVVQATMGSIGRVNVLYTDLAKFFHKIEGKLPVYGTYLDGENLFDQQNLSGKGVILIGNESRGISSSLNQFVSRRLFIPSFGRTDSGKAESLNASVATAIICAEFRKKRKNQLRIRK